jgi:hypothetical protein
MIDVEKLSVTPGKLSHYQLKMLSQVKAKNQVTTSTGCFLRKQPKIRSLLLKNLFQGSSQN